eukprot:TRINITY_DN1844_c0_g1_i1.p1 TRINITY_DN1844_c0_g1~~TRINITY_DN1844_c0_g1_i1.p1  ORF type:complete len:670 (-),score=226.28 TRINITY_DN1844_c0_g1_i1:464-2473(-)
MASETQGQDHGTDVHVEEKKVSDIVEGVQQESVSQSKENEENDAEKKFEVEEPASSEASVIDSEKKMDDIVETKKVEGDKAPSLDISVNDNSKVLENSEHKPDLTEVAEKKESDEQPQIADLPVSPIEVVEKTVEHSEATHALEQEPEVGIEPKEESAKEIVEKEKEQAEISDTPTVMETEKVEEGEKAPGLDVLVADDSKVVENFEQTPDTTVEVEKKVPDEQSKISDIPESLTEVLEKPVEHLEAAHVKEPDTEVGIEPREVSEVASEIVEKPEELSEISPVQGSASESVIEPKEQLNVAPEVTGEVEEISETFNTEGITEDEISQDEKNLAETVEKDTEPSKDEVCVKENVDLVVDSNKIEDECGKDQEAVPSQSLDTVLSSNQDVLANHDIAETCAANKEVVGGIVVPEILETFNGDSKTDASVEEKKKEECESDAVEVLVKEAAVDAGLPEPSTATDLTEAINATSVTDIAENEVKVEDKVEKEEKDVKIDESTPIGSTKTKEAGGSISSNEVTERSFEVQKAPVDAEATTKDTTSMIEPAVMPQESKLEVEPEAPLQTGMDKLEKSEQNASRDAEKMVEEVKNEENEKSDAPNSVESAKDEGDLKTIIDVPKQEVPAKPTQRQSNNILSKVKQSLVKVKKAIIGKSPSSKTLSSAAKGDIKVK